MNPASPSPPPQPGFTTPPGATPPPYQPPPPRAPGVAPAPAAPVGAPDEIRPKKRWIWISVAVMVLGVVAAIVVGAIGLIGISDTIDDFERVERGTGTIEVDSTDSLVVYGEEGSRFPRVTIIDPSGDEVRTRVYVGSLTYSFGGRSGQAAVTFQPDETGTYSVATDVDIAVGRSVAGPIVRTIAVPFAIGGLSVLIGAVMLVVVLVRRSRSTTKRATA